MNHTTNLHLPQWEADDRIHHDDFNDAMAAIDAAISTLQHFEIGMIEGYTGSDSVSVNLGAQPDMVMVGGRHGWMDGKPHSGNAIPGAAVALPNYPGYVPTDGYATTNAKLLEVTETGFTLYSGMLPAAQPYYYLALFL